MAGILERLKAWLFGASESPDSEAEADTESAEPTVYRCTACGNRIEGEEPDQCPVCQGTDFDAGEKRPNEGSEKLDPNATRRTTSGDDEDAVEQLKRLREERENREE